MRQWTSRPRPADKFYQWLRTATETDRTAAVDTAGKILQALFAGKPYEETAAARQVLCAPKLTEQVYQDLSGEGPTRHALPWLRTFGADNEQESYRLAVLSMPQLSDDDLHLFHIRSVPLTVAVAQAFTAHPSVSDSAVLSLYAQAYPRTPWPHPARFSALQVLAEHSDTTALFALILPGLYDVYRVREEDVNELTSLVLTVAGHSGAAAQLRELVQGRLDAQPGPWGPTIGLDTFTEFVTTVTGQ